MSDFQTADLARFADLLDRADHVVPLIDVHHGRPDRMTIALRHDIDGNNGAWENALAMARWEHSHGYRSTYYILPTAPYWSPAIADGLREMAWLGHEIGYHNNALAESRRRGVDPFVFLAETVEQLRSWSGEAVVSTTAHGDEDCRPGGFVNYQIWAESATRGDRTPMELGIEPRRPEEFGFEFQGEFLPRPHYISDSGGSWTTYSTVPDITTVLDEYPYTDGHLTVLQHPDWWPVELFEPERVAA